MFIREIVKQNKGYKKKFVYHALMESFRAKEGPRHRLALGLGRLDIPRDKWKTLANRIEQIVAGQESLFLPDREIESLARHYALLLQGKQIEERGVGEGSGQLPRYEEIDIDSVSNCLSRTIGAEHVSLSILRRLGFPEFLSELGFTEKEAKIAQLLIVGRMAFPASEWQTYHWAKDISAIGELLKLDLKRMSHNQLYKVSDRLLEQKEGIEKELAHKERDLFSLKEKIILYDLTNTYFETDIGKSKKKRYGRSKEKRKDCPLVTLGLVIDEMGFVKRSKVFRGNVGESKTLFEMLQGLDNNASDGKKKTVIIDAGIATEDNLKAIKEHYDYICVARNKPLDRVPEDGFVTLRHTRDNKVEARMVRQNEEIILYCRSLKKGRKEEAMRTRFQERFETDLQIALDALHKKGGTKKYPKVLERIGRLRQRHSRVARYYDIEIERKKDKVVDIHWQLKPDTDIDERFSGTYYLRTSRTDLTEEEIWSLYVSLTDVEDAFRSMKSELRLRPNNHQLDKRIDGHIFITVLSYHVVNSIQWFLHRKDIYMQWDTIRKFLSNQVRVTTRMTNRQGQKIFIRNTSEPELFHAMIAYALNISDKPLGRNTGKA